MERIHSDQLATIFTALATAFGRDEALAQAQRMLDRALDCHPGKTSPSEVSALESPTVQPGTLQSTPQTETGPVAASATVLGLPDGYTWEHVPVEVKLSKNSLRDAMAEQRGVVLRHEDSADGDLYYAVYDQGSKTFHVPAGYRTSRGQVAEITVNGAYRWLQVGVARAIATKTHRRNKSKAKTAHVTLPKWRGREYEPFHEEKAHSGNVRIGSLMRDKHTGTLDFVAAIDGKTALIERENGDLDDFKLTAQPSEMLRVVGFSSQYAEEAAARG